MLFRFLGNDVLIGKCLWDWFYLPRFIFKNKQTEWGFLISWLGGCIVWSRFKGTFKDTDRV
jgi:hypothetical protein